MSRKSNHVKTKDIRKAFKIIESIGLEVIGPGVNLDTGQMVSGNMCFDATQAIKYHRLERTDQIWVAEE